MAKVVCVLYDDPVDGYPTSYARNDLPKIEKYPDGQTLPTPKGIDFKPGALLGSISGELGLRKYLESNGHTLVVTSSKDGPDSVLERELADAEVVISQPFWPAYLTAERIAKAPKLKLALTAGIGSDHVNLQSAIDRGITVAAKRRHPQAARRTAPANRSPGDGCAKSLCQGGSRDAAGHAWQGESLGAIRRLATPWDRESPCPPKAAPPLKNVCKPAVIALAAWCIHYGGEPIGGDDR